MYVLLPQSGRDPLSYPPPGFASFSVEVIHIMHTTLFYWDLLKGAVLQK